eukprot:365676-Chlamydomonas_euryale.AAC.10
MRPTGITHTQSQVHNDNKGCAQNQVHQNIRECSRTESGSSEQHWLRTRAHAAARHGDGRRHGCARRCPLTDMATGGKAC